MKDGGKATESTVRSNKKVETIKVVDANQEKSVDGIKEASGEKVMPSVGGKQAADRETGQHSSGI